MKPDDPAIPDASALTGAEYFIGVQSGLDVRIGTDQVATLAAGSSTVVPGNFHATGKYITQASGGNCGAAQNYTAANGSLRAFPLVVSKAFTFTQIRIRVTTFAAGSKLRVGIYTDNGSSYPNALVSGSDTGEFDTDTPNGVKSSGTVSITLNPGLYWIATNSNGGPVLDGMTQYSCPAVIGVTDIVSAGTDHNRWLVASAYGAMPSTFPGGATSGSAAFPVVGLLV